MRTLGTQVRLRRLIRQHGDTLARLEEAGPEIEQAAAAARRLADLLADVGRAWMTDSSAAGCTAAELEVFDTHVRRTLRLLEATAAEYARAPAADRRHWLAEQFNGAAVPLLLFLRGLEDTPVELLDGWLAPALAKSA